MQDENTPYRNRKQKPLKKRLFYGFIEMAECNVLALLFILFIGQIVQYRNELFFDYGQL